jgi:hypothetical protein
MRLGVGADERRIDVALLSDFEGEVLTHPDTRGLFAMWTALRGDRPAPFRAELDAGRIGARAPFLAILEYVGPSNFRIRIAGDRLNRWFGMELRGMSALSLVEAAARNHFQSALNRLTAEPAAAAVSGAAEARDGRSCGFEMVLLPMRSDFGRIDRVLVGLWLEESAAAAPLRLRADAFVVAPIFDEAEADAALAEPPAGGSQPGGSQPGGPQPVGSQPSDPPAAGPEPEHAPAPEPDARGARPGARRGHLRVVK